MFGFLKSVAKQEPAPEHRDGLLGLLVNKSGEAWCGEIPYRNYHVRILVPGAKYQPSSIRIAFARTLLPNLEAKVELALDYAAATNPDLWRGRLMLSAVNLLYRAESDSFALDFLAAGDRSGKNWHVRFEGGQPTLLEYC